MKIQQKKGNQEIRNFSLLSGKSGQEEMVGFVIIVVIVGVILLVLLGFLLRGSNRESVESFEIENFIQATLQYTTECSSQIDFLSVQNLIVACNRKEQCLDGKDSCDVLNSTLIDLMKSSWKVGEQSAIKGYSMEIVTEQQGILKIEGGNQTDSYKGSFQDFAKSGDNYEISLNVYY